MTTHTTRATLQDIASNCEFALDLIKKRGPKNFTHDTAFRYALEHALVILSTAISHIPHDMRTQQPTAPWTLVQEIGSRITYGERQHVEDMTVWNAITTHLAPLHKVAQRMLADLDQPRLPL
ncbi:MAG: HepT-like ribonuclease domain-containing protein [Hyphomicrobium sp.]